MSNGSNNKTSIAVIDEELRSMRKTLERMDKCILSLDKKVDRLNESSVLFKEHIRNTEIIKDRSITYLVVIFGGFSALVSIIVSSMIG